MVRLALIHSVRKKIVKLSSVVLSFVLLSTSSAAFAADTNSFDFYVWGKKVGTTSYSVSTSKGTTKVSSRVDRHDFPVPMTEEFRIGSDGLVLSGTVTRPNDKFTAFYNPDKQHTKIDILPTKNGEPQPAVTWNLPRPDLLIGLMEDSATWQMLMDTVMAHPHADNAYPILNVGENNFTPDRVEVGHLSAPEAGKGTLDGKPIELRHFVLTLPKGAVDLYVDADGRLMQAEVASYGYKHVRTGFALGN
jgi:hypothetical protein